MNINFCTGVGIITNTNLQIESYNDSPAVMISTFAENKWQDPICLVIQSDRDKRKCQAITEGDVILFNGELGSISGEVVVYTKKIIILKKNKLNSQIDMCKMGGLEFARYESFAIYTGKVIEISESGVVTIAIKKPERDFNGSLRPISFVKCECLDDVNLDQEVLCYSPSISNKMKINTVSILSTNEHSTANR